MRRLMFLEDDRVFLAPDVVAFYHRQNARIKSDIVTCPLKDNVRPDSQWTFPGYETISAMR